jgi:hypothetical protein
VVCFLLAKPFTLEVFLNERGYILPHSGSFVKCEFHSFRFFKVPPGAAFAARAQAHAELAFVPQAQEEILPETVSLVKSLY